MQYYAQQNKQFESDILGIGCIAGVLRMVIAIYRDLPLMEINLDFIVDTSLLVVFAIPLILMRFKVRFEYISVPFSFLVLGFLCANWIVLDGISGTGEYYFIGGMIMMALIHSGMWLVTFLTLCVVLEAGMLYVWLYHRDLMTYAIPQDLGSHHYLWITVVATIVLLYHKNQFDQKRVGLRNKKKNIEDKIKKLGKQNTALEEQKAMLEKSNDWLESNINQRSEKLLTQRKSIEKYLSVTLFEMGPYLESTLSSIEELDATTKKTQMGDLLLQSAGHLQSAIQSVTNKLKQGFFYNPEN